jgi:hypothetical protein
MKLGRAPAISSIFKKESLWIGSELRWNLMLPVEQFPRSTGRVALELSR